MMKSFKAEEEKSSKLPIHYLVDPDKLYVVTLFDSASTSKDNQILYSKTKT